MNLAALRWEPGVARNDDVSGPKRSPVRSCCMQVSGANRHAKKKNCGCACSFAQTINSQGCNSLPLSTWILHIGFYTFFNLTSPLLIYFLGTENPSPGQVEEWTYAYFCQPGSALIITTFRRFKKSSSCLGDDRNNSPHHQRYVSIVDAGGVDLI